MWAVDSQGGLLAEEDDKGDGGDEDLWLEYDLRSTRR